jgi:hypothetical protein
MRIAHIDLSTHVKREWLGRAEKEPRINPIQQQFAAARPPTPIVMQTQEATIQSRIRPSALLRPARCHQATPWPIKARIWNRK